MSGLKVVTHSATDKSLEIKVERLVADRKEGRLAPSGFDFIRRQCDPPRLDP